MEKFKVKTGKETVPFFLLAFWCLLPFLHFLYRLIYGMLGRFPTTEELAETGFLAKSYFYQESVRGYQIQFYIIGIATFLFGLYKLLQHRKTVFYRESIQQRPWLFLFGILLCWAVVCTMCSDHPLNQFIGDFYLRDGLSSYFMYAAAFFCALMITEEKKKRSIILIFLAVIVFLSGILILQFFQIPFLHYCFPTKRATVFNQFNHFGYVICMTVTGLTGLYLYDEGAPKRRKVLYLSGVFFVSAALLYNDTFGAYLAALCAFVPVYFFYSLRGNKVNWRVFLPLILFLLISAVNASGIIPGFNGLAGNLGQSRKDFFNIITNAEEAKYAGTGRMTLWKDTLERIGERPFLGFGPMGFYWANQITNNDSTHNEYLQITAFLGTPGILLYLSALVTLFIHHWKKIRELSPMTMTAAGMAVVYLISACFGNPVFNTAPYLWIFLGLTASGALQGEKDMWEGCAEPRKKPDLIPELAVIGVLIIGIFGGIEAYLIKNTELNNESADGECIECAVALVQKQRQEEGEVPPGEYYLDVDHFKLVPVEEYRPKSYGLGQTLNGNDYAKKPVSTEGDITTVYDTALDYTDSVVKVIVGSKKITVLWNADNP